MKWTIPAKTFLLGEYVAINNQSAIILTTTPCFELSLTQGDDLNLIHPNSPAGLWLQKRKIKTKLCWTDPYSLGGLGASSAQFVGAYLASCHIQNTSPNFDELLWAYDEVAWSGIGLKPSGYDVIAQTRQQIVFINKEKNTIEDYPWPFNDLSFFLIHTGFKLATHTHLQESTLPSNLNNLNAVVVEAEAAFRVADSQKFIECINTYHQLLQASDRLAKPSLALIQNLSYLKEILALKGCGALGADVLLLLCKRQDKDSLNKKLLSMQIRLLATESQVYRNNPLNFS